MVRLSVGLLSGGKLPNHHIENWCKENTKDRYAEHPSENGRAQRLPHFRARSRAEHERNYPGDKGKGRHENRPQAELAGFDDGGNGILAGVFNLLCVFDDENCILACESHEDDEADLRKDIIVHSPQQHSRERREDAHGNNKNDGKGKCPAFVLRGQGQEDEKDAKREDEERGIPRQNLLIGQVGPLTGLRQG
jgi:hypothetical protein